MLDEIDEKILFELRRDARISVTKLSEVTGRSRTAVQARIAKLEQTGQILGYSIKEPSSPETRGFSAIVLVTLEVRRNCEPFLEAVKAMPIVSTCNWIIGAHDFALLIRPVEKSELQKLIETIQSTEGVRHTETILSLHREF